MPYVDDDTKKALALWASAKKPGELNYLVTETVIEYVVTNGLSYGTINDILGALDGASKEFYRRIAVPYEDQKIEDNGDVYSRIIPKEKE